MSKKRGTPQKLFIDLDNRKRECGICHEIKVFDDFNKMKKSPGGVKSYCRPCDRKYQSDRLYYAKYKITYTEYLQRLEEQRHMCAICGSTEHGHHGRFVIDHDHVTGKVRKLLCSNCNSGIGMFRDNERIVMNAAMYLRQYNQGM